MLQEGLSDLPGLIRAGERKGPEGKPENTFLRGREYLSPPRIPQATRMKASTSNEKSKEL